jgi:predicted alpha/beta-fold hydrolase
MGTILSTLSKFPKSSTFLLSSLLLTLYNRYQSQKYRKAILKRIREKRDPETPLTKDFSPYTLNLPGAPTKTLIQGGPSTPLLAFTDSLGLEIAVYHWPATNGNVNGPCLLLCHGLDINAESEFCIRPGHLWEGSWQKELCDAGFNVYGWDHHGMGRSESVMTSDHRTTCYDFNDYINTAVQMRKIVGYRHPKSKVFLHGQSLGGCIAIRTAQRHPSLFHGLSLACPAVFLEKIKKVRWLILCYSITIFVNFFINLLM